MTKFESCFRIIGALLEDDPAECAVKPVNISVHYMWDGLYTDETMTRSLKMAYGASAKNNNGETLLVPGVSRRLDVTAEYESPEAAIEAFYEYLVICLKEKRERLAKSLDATGKHMDMFAAVASA